MAVFDSPIVTATGHALSAVSLSLTTALTNDLIVVIAYAGASGGGAAPAISSITGGSLSWTQRIQSNASTSGSMEIWWAIAASPLSAATLTATYASAYDCATLCAFAINGANISTPWDANASLPAKQSFTTSTTPSFSALSTTATDTLALFAVGTSNNWSPPGTPPSSFATLGTASIAGHSLFAEFAVAGNGKTSALSGATIAWGSAIPGSSGAGEAIFDAIALTAPLTITAAEVTQAGVEVWGVGTPGVQVTQAGVEIWGSGNPAVQVTQLGTEIWATVATPGGQPVVYIAT